jgi:IS30 family transposase
MEKLQKGKNTKSPAKELFYLLLPYKRWVHSITSGNSSKFYGHKYVAEKLNASFFFAHPYSS